MKNARERLGSEVVKRGYSDEEISHIYELARFSLENGDFRRAEIIVSGLVLVAPDYIPAWLALSFVYLHNRDYEAAMDAARQALKVDSQGIEAQLFLITCLLSTGDYNTAGTYLGEVGERVDNEIIDNPHIARFYRMQLARFNSR